MSDRALRIAVAALALVGAGIAAYLAYAKYAILATAFSAGETARLAGAVLALGGLLFSGYLVVVQIVAVGAFCQWCLASDLVMLLLAAATVARLRAAQPAPG